MRLLRNQILLKSFAVFFAVEFLASAVLPSVSYAFTAGPTAPESTSFEPVDTTDMVDLKTGDFTYNVPLIEVPGPAGGYPLSLSYHAGIQPELDASWVGLGFTLNPGSISRLVNGYPDDHNNITDLDHSFWEGGEGSTTTVGASIGIANIATVSAGMTFAQDTYRGNGVGGYVGVGIGYGGVGINAQVGMSPYGSSYGSIGLSVGVGEGTNAGLNIGASVGVSLNSDAKLNANAGAQVGVAGTSLMGVSIGSGNSKVSVSLGGGVAGVYNSKANNVTINAKSFQIDIPVYYGVNLRLGRDYQRYFIDETVGIHTFGSLYMDDVPPNFSSAFDTYDLLDNSLDISIHNDPEKVLGGSFPDTDFYTVAAQGVYGNIRPYSFQQHLYRQDKLDEKNDNNILSKGYILDDEPNSKQVEFRFENDFSNRYEYEPGNFQVANDKVSFDFAGNPTTGEAGNNGISNNHLAGSNHIEWFTNNEILLSSLGNGAFKEGFLNCVSKDFNRNSNSQVGAFTITNGSGVTYNFSLPVYSFNEVVKTENSATKQDANGLSYSELKKPERYAYTWLLTSVTGPDYIDKNSNGIADHGDWGYWVNFEYSKWLNDYNWRNPGEGTNRDLDGEFEFYSSGQKEIYYLDKILTETHVAVFEKSIRNDGREVADRETGGFDRAPIMGDSGPEHQCKVTCASITNGPTEYANCIDNCDKSYEDVTVGYTYTRNLLKLDRIKLFNYSDFAASRNSDEYTLRSIDLNYDYALAPDTPNSFEGRNYSTKLGKLTLRKLEFFGKSKLMSIPPMSFDYKNASYEKDKFDSWGFYKKDFDSDYRDATNEIIGRSTTEISALDVDAWSLNEIVTSLGVVIKIKYESDQYHEVALVNNHILRTKEVIDYAPNKLKISFWEQGINLNTYFAEGQPTSIDFSTVYNVNNENQRTIDCSCDDYEDFEDDKNIAAHFVKAYNGEVIVNEIHNQNGSTEAYIIVTGNELYDELKVKPKIWSFKYDRVRNQPCYASSLPSGIISCKYIYSGVNAWPHYFVGGVISANNSPVRYGGGLRVNSVSLTDDSESRKPYRVTSYEYTHGVTSYEPSQILVPKINPDFKDEVADTKTLPKAKAVIQRAMLKRLYKQMINARVVPGPGVIYEFVTVREKNVTPDGVEHTIPNYSKFEFETFNSGMVDIFKEESYQRIDGMSGNHDGVNFDKSFLNKMVLKNFSSRVGNLKSITLYDASNDSPISKTTNHYLHDGLDGSFEQNRTVYETDVAEQFLNQGVTEESFTRARIAFYKKNDSIPYFNEGEESRFDKDSRHLLATISKRENFPSISTGQTNINFKTGITSRTENLAFDFYSGEPVEILTTDSYGNRYKSVSVPAYKNYSGMGLKVGNKTNRNMLTQTSQQYSYVVNSENNPIGLLSASIQTWSDQVDVLNLTTPQTNIWRLQSSFVWNGKAALNSDGSYKYDDLVNADEHDDFIEHPFNFNLEDENPTKNDHWIKTSELMLYDIYSHGLEAKDVNGDFASTRMNIDQNKVIASASNARYDEIAYAGAEYLTGNTEKEGGVSRGQGDPSRAFKHTGEYSLSVGPQEQGFRYTIVKPSVDVPKKYRASVWVYAAGAAETQSDLDKLQLYYIINGSEKSVHPVLQKSKSKSWYLLNIDIEPDGANDIFIGVRNNTQRGVYFDDFRVHPLNASLSSFVYDQFTGELNYILDANNFYTRFEYDALGRLVRTSKELLNFDYGEGKESARLKDAVMKEIKYNYGKGN